MKISEIRELTIEELKERIGAEEAAYNLKRINHAISPIDSSADLKKARVLIARLKTVLRQRELENN